MELNQKPRSKSKDTCNSKDGVESLATPHILVGNHGILSVPKVSVWDKRIIYEHLKEINESHYIGSWKRYWLRPLTNSKPKCLVELAGKSLLEHQLDIFECGITDIHVIGGYNADQLINKKYKLHKTIITIIPTWSIHCL